MAKEYNKLTEGQFRRLIRSLPEYQEHEKKLQQALHDPRASGKLKELLKDAQSWAFLYELPFSVHLGFIYVALGEDVELKRIASLSDPQEEMLQAIEKEIATDKLDENFAKDAKLSEGNLFLLLHSLQRSILSIRTFKKSLSALVEEAREGNDNSLFDAVRIDRSAVACPSIAARIAKAEMLGQKQFFIRLRSALKGPQKKHMEGLRDMRYALVILRELGIKKMSDDQLEHLLVDVLKVYPKNANARKNIRKQFYESSKIKSL